jgi:hypothetical protein
VNASRSVTRVVTAMTIVGTLFGTSFQLAHASRAEANAGPAARQTKNLIKNPGAEAGSGSSDGSVVDVPNWEPTGATSVKYGATGGFPGMNTPGPAKRGKNFFGGGPYAAENVESQVQTVQLGSYAVAIDAGRVKFTLDAWLGGYASDGDNATVYLTFYTASHQYLSGAVIGPVTHQQRHDQTKLMSKTGKGPVPKTARSVMVDVEFVGTNGGYNNAYADNLSLILTGV